MNIHEYISTTEKLLKTVPDDAYWQKDNLLDKEFINYKSFYITKDDLRKSGTNDFIFVFAPDLNKGPEIKYILYVPELRSDLQSFYYIVVVTKDGESATTIRLKSESGYSCKTISFLISNLLQRYGII